MLNFIVCVIINLQSLNSVHSCITINLFSVAWVVNIFMLSEFLWQLIAIVLQIRDEMHRTIPRCLLLQETTCKGTLYVAKVHYKLRVVSGLNLPWYGSMEWNMEENFSMEWKWKWRKLPVWNIKKIIVVNSIPYHALTTIRLLHWVVSLRTNQFDLVSRIDPSWEEE